MIRFFSSFTLVSLCAALLAACAPAPTIAPTPLSSTPTFDAGPLLATAALMEDWQAAFQTWDAEKIVSFYSPEAIEYDATFDLGYYMNYSAIAGFYRSEGFKTSFEFAEPVFFVSNDGRFAAVYGTIKDVEGEKPAVSLLEFKQGKIIWQYDYYGGEYGWGGPWLAFPDNYNRVVPDKAGEITKALTAWEAAFNRRDLRSYLSFYQDRVQVIDVIDPQWRIFSKPLLEIELAAQFASPDFKSNLGNFFVSSNGYFAAVQGVYQDQKTAAIPFVSILETQGGQIIKQYNFMVYREKK